MDSLEEKPLTPAEQSFHNFESIREKLHQYIDLRTNPNIRYGYPNSQIENSHKDNTYFKANHFEEENMAKLYNRMLEEADSKGDFSVDISTAYFTLGGWNSISKNIAKAKKIRLLIGVEPLPSFALKDSPGNYALNQVNIRKFQEDSLKQSRDYSDFKISNIQNNGKLVKLIFEGNLEVRLFTQGFLHAKTFAIITKDQYTSLSIGSANLTHSGLTSNHEANLITETILPLEESKTWYEIAWAKSEDYTQKMSQSLKTLGITKESHIHNHRSCCRRYAPHRHGRSRR